VTRCERAPFNFHRIDNNFEPKVGDDSGIKTAVESLFAAPPSSNVSPSAKMQREFQFE
jgi:hypothetical protein